MRTASTCFFDGVFFFLFGALLLGACFVGPSNSVLLMVGVICFPIGHLAIAIGQGYRMQEQRLKEIEARLQRADEKQPEPVPGS